MERVLFVFGLIALNLLALVFATYFQTLLFLDTLATAIAAFAAPQWFPDHWYVGPAAGAVVGLLTNLSISALLKRYSYLRFLHVNIICGILWGFAGKYFPSANAPEPTMLLYIVIVGGLVGVLSGASAIPVRINARYESDHLVDKLSRQIIAKSTTKWTTWGGVYSTELTLCHFPDKLVATTVGIMWILGAGPRQRDTYHDLVEFAAGYYYIAMGYAIRQLKTYEVDLKADELIILGPLGLFAALLAFPVFFRMCHLIP